MAAIATLLLITLLSLSVAASAQEAPLVEVPRPVESFWSSLFSTQATVPLNVFVVYDTSSCRTLYEGKCNIEAKVMFDCYADSAGACHCYTKTEAGKCGVSGGTCTDSDGGDNVLTKGTATAGTISKTDSCISSSTIREAFCSSGTVITKDYYCPASQTCQDGACKTVPTSAMCRDTDGGINPQTRGTVYWSGLSSNQPFSDTCNSDTQIKEYYCNGDAVESVARNCGSNERCTRDSGQFEASCKPVTGCTDTDGNNIYSKGSVTWNSQTATDTCNQDTRVTEYSCSNGVRIATDITCPSGYKCESGACIQGTPPPTTTPPSTGTGTGFAGALCVDDSSCKEGLACYGTDTQKAQGTGTCVVPVGPTTEQPAAPTSSICCKGTDWGANYGPAGGTFYYYTTSTTCPNNDPKMEASQCQAESEKKEEGKQEDAAKKGEVPSGSIPSFKKELDRLNQAEASSSLCMIDDQCASDFCDTSAEVEKKVEHVFPEGSTSDTSLERVNNAAGPLKLAQTITTDTQTFKSGVRVSGLCREEPEGFDFGKFFKDNQAVVIGGGALLLLLMFLPSILPKRS